MRHSTPLHPAPTRQAQRLAFTLVELLVVIAIIGALVGLLLPAVQSARETARNNTCKNNIRNLALAATQYDSSLGELPGYVNALVDTTGTRNDDGAFENGRRASWVVMLFPYLEQTALWDQWSRELPGTSDYDPVLWANVPAATIPEIELMICPSDPIEGEGLPFSSYVVNAGQAADCATRGGGDPPFPSGIPEANAGNGENVANGVFFDLSANANLVRNTDGRETDSGRERLKSSIDYVSANDGTSRTMMISENLHAVYWAYDDSPDPMSETLEDNSLVDVKQAFGFVWHNQVPSTSGAQGDAALRRVNGATEALTPLDMLELQGRPELGYPSSAHPGGVNVVFVDGHTAFISERIEQRTYAQLMTSNRKRSTYFDIALGDDDADFTDRRLQQPSDDDF